MISGVETLGKGELVRKGTVVAVEDDGIIIESTMRVSVDKRPLCSRITSTLEW